MASLLHPDNRLWRPDSLHPALQDALLTRRRSCATLFAPSCCRVFDAHFCPGLEIEKKQVWTWSWVVNRRFFSSLNHFNYSIIVGNGLHTLNPSAQRGQAIKNCLAEETDAQDAILAAKVSVKLFFYLCVRWTTVAFMVHGCWYDLRPSFSRSKTKLQT